MKVPKGWEPPRCRHGAILLACDHERGDCPEQDAYLDEHDRQLEAWRKKIEQNLRDWQALDAAESDEVARYGR